MSKNEYEETVRELYPTFSQVEIAEATHTSKSTVRRVVTGLHLTRTKEEEKEIRSRIRRKLIKKERARIVFGLDQHTNIKLVTNPRKVKYRTKLKNDGYIVMRGSNTIYYTPEQKRHRHREENAATPSITLQNRSVIATVKKMRVRLDWTLPLGAYRQ